ncbi:MAG: ankyrin repeat domain-containing protein [Candidatus Aminicenantes bacterium]|nr:ankyrin repeat domain-containing protein [Candidatus Aminicenantes bacterium]
MKSKISFFILIFSVLLISCSSSEKKARDRLEQSGTSYSETNFYEAVTKGETEVVNLFLAAGMSPNVRINDRSVLVEASRMGHTEIALALIDTGADIDNQDSYGVSPLMFAAISGSAEIMAKLMECHADVNVKDQDGRTALIEVLTTENDLPIDIIKSLCEAGADVNVRIQNGLTPLMLAADGNSDILRLLLQAGADVNARDDYGASVLKRAKYDHENTQILIEAGAKE